MYVGSNMETYTLSYAKQSALGIWSMTQGTGAAVHGVAKSRTRPGD